MYFGITSQLPIHRWGVNGVKYKQSPYLYNAICKYGWDSFEHNILFVRMTKDEACAKEQELIAKFNTMDRRYGYNATTGGEAFTMSKESSQKKSVAMRGNKNCLGRKCSEETAKKISKAQIGKIVSEETKHKQSEAAKRRHVPCSEEKKEKLRSNYPHMRKVYCLETKTVYRSVQECARQLGVYATAVSKVCRGKLDSTGGYHLNYYEE